MVNRVSSVRWSVMLERRKARSGQTRMKVSLSARAKDADYKLRIKKGRAMTMGWVWLSLGVIAAAVAAMLASMIRAEAVISRKGEDDEAIVRVSALGGLLRLKFEIPEIIAYGWHKMAVRHELVDVNRAKLLRGKLARIGERIGGRSRARFRKLRRLADAADLRQWLKATLGRVHCREVRWSTEIGIGDAADTAFAAGLLWAVQSSLLGFALHHVKLEQMPVMTVTPLYGESRFSTCFRCKIRIRLVYALSAGLQLAIRMMKARGRIRS